MEHTLRNLKTEQPETTTAYFRQDNAGCYKSATTQPVKWEGVSNVNNLLYEDTGLILWRAYDIGKGKTFLLSQLQGMVKFFC